MPKPAESKIAWWVLASVASIALSGSCAPILPLDASYLEARPASSTALTNSTTGLLALGLPSLGDRVGCTLCRLSRESGANFTAVEHPTGGPSRIILMRHANVRSCCQPHRLRDHSREILCQHLYKSGHRPIRCGHDHQAEDHVRCSEDLGRFALCH